MRVFVTGATGFIGSAVVTQLIAAGHQVLGLARSEASAASLKAVGAGVHRGDLDDLDSLTRAAKASDGVIHAAFVHDFLSDNSGQDFFSRYLAAAATDRRAIETLGSAIAGSDRPLVVTSGTAVLASNRLGTDPDSPRFEPNGPGTENDAPDPASSAALRIASEEATLLMAARGVRASIIRLPPSVHGDGDRGFVPGLISFARQKGVSGYVDEGLNRWPTVHRLDAAILYRLALESAPAGSRLHAVAEEGVPLRDLASAIGRHLNIPAVSVPRARVSDHFGWLTNFIAMDNPASSTLTRQRLSWLPTQRKLIEDLDVGAYFKSPA